MGWRATSNKIISKFKKRNEFQNFVKSRIWPKVRLFVKCQIWCKLCEFGMAFFLRMLSKNSYGTVYNIQAYRLRWITSYSGGFDPTWNTCSRAHSEGFSRSIWFSDSWNIKKSAKRKSFCVYRIQESTYLWKSKSESRVESMNRVRPFGSGLNS